MPKLKTESRLKARMRAPSGSNSFGSRFSDSLYFLCAILGFLICYFCFFVRPVFLNPNQQMQVIQTVPNINPIGVDLRTTIKASDLFFKGEKSPYVGAAHSAYPPLVFLLCGPLTLLDGSSAYSLVTVLSVVCFIFTAFIFPFLASGENKISSLGILIFISGLFSYGFQFELERGQFNGIAMFFCFLAIWVFHHHPRYRYIAYLLFSISVQLKLYPAIFVLMFIRDWRDWRANIKLFSGLALFNFFLLFLLGFDNFLAYFPSVLDRSVCPYFWDGNHSIPSFSVGHPFELVGILNNTYHYNLGDPRKWTLCFLLAIFMACFLPILANAYRQDHKAGINRYLFLACTMGAMLITPESNDYKLVLLAGPVALCFSDNDLIGKAQGGMKWILWALAIVFFIAYSSTLYSFNNKPQLFQSNLPALMLMLLITAFLSFLHNPAMAKK